MYYKYIYVCGEFPLRTPGEMEEFDWLIFDVFMSKWSYACANDHICSQKFEAWEFTELVPNSLNYIICNVQRKKFTTNCM